jgi:glucosamine-6-phosphate deaminase
LTLFALDEYVGLPPGHPESYGAAVAREIAEPLGIPASQVHLPAETHPERYEPSIHDAGGIDVQLLGIGRNGHIGFNEPGSPFDSRTRITDLEDSTRIANARFFGSIEEVPRRSVTQGIATILEARRLIVLAFGAEKGEATAAAILGPLTESVPASAIRLHSDITWVLDTACASRIFPA